MIKTKIILFLFYGLTYTNAYSQLISNEQIREQPYSKYVLYDQSSGDNIYFYLSEYFSESKSPLIIYIQGSGHQSLFAKDTEGNIYPTSGHITWTYEAQNRSRVLIIEKPGVQFLEQKSLDKEFDEKFSLKSWSKRIQQTIQHVLDTENIDTSQVMVVGHSEGGLVAANVAKNMGKTISHITILAGEGASQLYSLYKFAESGKFFNAEGKNQEGRIDSLHNVWDKIISEPLSVDKKFWGFTYLRWSSFLSTSVLEELSSYNGKILIIQGEQDRNVHPESAKFLYTSLLSKGKDVTLKMIPNADHSFNLSTDKSTDGWSLVAKRTVEWFLN